MVQNKYNLNSQSLSPYKHNQDPASRSNYFSLETALILLIRLRQGYWQIAHLHKLRN
uniref:Uncharacterized protein n=1 Tax=Arundo donax TaxID=35708 RepID=A0A0A9ASH6_ARUDO